MIQSLSVLRQQFLADNQSFHEFADDDPRKALPFSLQQQKKRAKELLQHWRGSKAWNRLLQNHPDAQQLSADNVKLAHAQLVIAREQGFSSWARLKHHIETAENSRQALRSGQPTALDADARTLHIRCGNDVMYKLAVTGFRGDFLSFADPYIQGPVPTLDDLDAFIHLRAGFMASNDPKKARQYQAELATGYHALERGREYERIAFWFEHDAYDVLAFIKLLHFFSDVEKRAADMRFICVNQYPGVARFNGIGQLPADAMRVLWEQFQPLTEAQFVYGRQCWQAFTDSTPQALQQLMAQDAPPLPEIIPALQRHIRELPWLADGLSLCERITLRILADKGTLEAPQLFYHWYTSVYEPLVFMGDSSYWRVLDALSQAPEPAITVQKQSDRKIDWQVELTAFGKQLLAGKAHWMQHNPYNRWFGGVHNRSGAGIWYWDDAAQRVLFRPD